MDVGIDKVAQALIRPQVDMYCKMAAAPPAEWIVPTPFVTTPNVDIAVGTNDPDTAGAARPIIPDAVIVLVGAHI